MNSSYLNMAAGAFLGTVFVVMSVSLVSEALYHSEAPEQEGFAIEVVEAEAGGGAAEEEATPIAVLLQNADPAAGEASFRKCASCHDATEGGPNKVGPNLWGVVNRPIASHEGFSYSAAMTEFSQGGEVVWDYEHLAGFLHDPRGYIEGTAMSFAGLSREDELANVIAYLRTLSNEPAPLPEPEAAPAEGEEAAAAEGGEGEAAAEGEAAEGEAAAGAADEQAAPAEGGDAAEQDGAATAEEAAPEGSAAGAEAAGEGNAVPADGGTQAPTEEAAPAGDDAAAGEEAAPAEETASAEQEQSAEEAQPAEEGAATEEQGAPEEQAAPSGQEAVPAEEQAVAPAEDAAAEDQAASADAAAEAGPAVALLAEADVANGESLFRRCQACHTVDEGGQNRVGPNLWGVVNRPVASHEGFSYSDAMVEYAQGGEVVWDYNHLDAFLLAPRDEVDGTKMAFPGLKDDADRADVIAYLRTLAAEPAPLPGE